MSTTKTSPAQRVVTLSPLNICWILHVVLELPTGLIGLLQPNAVPLANMNEGLALVVRVRQGYAWNGADACAAPRHGPDRV